MEGIVSNALRKRKRRKYNDKIRQKDLYRVIGNWRKPHYSKPDLDKHVNHRKRIL